MFFKKRKYRYFVSYTGIDHSGEQHWGNCEVDLDKPITSMDSIKAIQAAINEDNRLVEAIVLYWKRFE